MTRQVAVVGPGDAAPALCDLAEQVGAGLAAAGAVVVTGGVGGVMTAAERGALGAGGRVLSLLPDDRFPAGHGSDRIMVPTGLGQGRNLLVVRAATVVVSVGGSWGTLSEVALALRLGVPVVGLQSWGVVDERGERVAGVEVAADAAAAVARAVALLPQAGR